MPQTPSIGKLCMLIVLCAITSYVATHDQKLYFICVTMPDLENPLENFLWA